MDNFPIKTRLQNFLANIVGEGEELKPRTRKEAILAKAAGRDIDIEPKTGTEYWLMKALENGGGSSTKRTTIFVEQTVTTVQGDGVNSGSISVAEGTDIPDSLIVTFDEEEYTCPKQEVYGMATYGALYSGSGIDFSNYPFIIVINDNEWMFATENAGSFKVKGEEELTAIIPTGQITLTADGIYDVKKYKNAEVKYSEYVPVEFVCTSTTSNEFGFWTFDGKFVQEGYIAPGKLGACGTANGTAHSWVAHFPKYKQTDNKDAAGVYGLSLLKTTYNDVSSRLTLTANDPNVKIHLWEIPNAKTYEDDYLKYYLLHFVCLTDVSNLVITISG